MGGDQTGNRPDNPVTSGLAQPGGHYSHVSVANGFVFVSGQLPITASGEKLINASFDVQVEQVLSNVGAALAAAGSGVDGLAQVRVYLQDIENWPRFNEIYARWAGNARPSRAIVPTGPLHFGFEIEMEAIAVVQRKPVPGSIVC